MIECCPKIFEAKECVRAYFLHEVIRCIVHCGLFSMYRSYACLDLGQIPVLETNELSSHFPTNYDDAVTSDT